MVRRVQGTFRTSRSGAYAGRMNALDDQFPAAIPANSSGRTGGATLLDPVSFFPAAAAGWEVLGFSIGAKMAIPQNVGGGFGKFGKVVTGLTTIGDQTNGGVVTPYIQPALPLPNDMSLIADLWNPDSDQLPPVFAAGDAPPTGLQVSVSQTLSEHIPVPRGNNMLIGIWVLPSLMHSANGLGVDMQVAVMDGVWSVVYDDGSPNTPG